MKRMIGELVIITIVLGLLASCNAPQRGPQGGAPCTESAPTEPVQHICSPETFEAQLHAKQPVVLKCFSQWCHPCTLMKPLFEAVAKKYQGKARFLAIDCDQAAMRPVTRRYITSGIPTFVFFNANGEVIETQVGMCSMEKLEALVKRVLPR